MHILDPAPLKQRKKLKKFPAVNSYRDIKANSGNLTRILYRVDKTVFPEFALYHDRATAKHKQTILEALQHAGFEADPTAKGRYVLRTNKFNVFIFL
jgi:hypothetical protein